MDAFEDIDVLLSMVEDLEAALDRHMAVRTPSYDEIPRILQTCEQMRAKEVNAAVSYWLAAIEQHAAKLTQPAGPTGADGNSFASTDSDRLKLRKGLYLLRSQIMRDGSCTVH